MNDEPSVLDYVKALLTPWRGTPPTIPELPKEGRVELSSPDEVPLGKEGDIKHIEPMAESMGLSVESIRPALKLPWRAISSAILALIAQASLEPTPDRTAEMGIVLYSLAAVLAVWSFLQKEWSLPDIPEVEVIEDTLRIRWVNLWMGLGFGLLAFIAFGGNRFTWINLILWLMAIGFIVSALWLKGESGRGNLSIYRDRLTGFIAGMRVSPWAGVLVATGLVILFFRLYRLSSVPPEMVSDHAEKLLDIWDVLHGETRIFFPRNTGREAFQMYLTAAVIKIFGTGYSFTSLKIGTALAGLATLPFIYLLGREIANRRVGLLAMLFAGIAYWPNVITRVALRFTFYPLFVAPTLYFLIRGLRRESRNDFLLAGVFLGLGLHGYTPFRIMPFAVLLAAGLILLHGDRLRSRQKTLSYLVILVISALMLFLPLLRFWVENPELFGYRAFTRLGSVERPLPGPAWLIFLENLGRALAMFGWNNGEIWPVSVTNRPALDVVSAAFFHIGVVLLLIRYIVRRNWLDLFFILSVPVLLLPSVLSLAFPSENPALNRTAGAMVPVFIITALAFEGFLRGLEGKITAPLGKWLSISLAALLLLWSGRQNYDLVFNQYQTSYSLSSWNSSEIGQVLQKLTSTIVQEPNAYVVAYPHWVDTRLVGINAGYPTRDFAIWPEDFSKTLDQQGTKVFIVRPDDSNSLEALQLLYPLHLLNLYDSKLENKDFYIFLALTGFNSTDGVDD